MFYTRDLVGKVNFHLISSVKAQENHFLEFTNLNLILPRLQSAIRPPKLWNFALLKLMLVTKQHILNKMVPFITRKNDFIFLTKHNQQKCNIVRVKVKK